MSRFRSTHRRNRARSELVISPPTTRTSGAIDWHGALSSNRGRYLLRPTSVWETPSEGVRGRCPASAHRGEQRSNTGNGFRKAPQQNGTEGETSWKAVGGCCRACGLLLVVPGRDGGNKESVRTPK